MLVREISAITARWELAVGTRWCSLLGTGLLTKWWSKAVARMRSWTLTMLVGVRALAFCARTK